MPMELHQLEWRGRRFESDRSAYFFMLNVAQSGRARSFIKTLSPFIHLSLNIYHLPIPINDKCSMINERERMPNMTTSWKCARHNHKSCRFFNNFRANAEQDYISNNVPKWDLINLGWEIQCTKRLLDFVIRNHLTKLSERNANLVQ